MSQGSFAVLCVAILYACPFVFGYTMFSRTSDLPYRPFVKKYGTMYQGIWLEEDSVYALSYTIVFQLRRILFVGLMFLLQDYPGIQIQLFIYSSVLYVIYLNWFRIYELPESLLFEDANEMGFLFICYHLALFSNLIGDPKVLSVLGLSMICSTALILIGNILLIIWVNVKGLILAVKRRRL